jgi:UDP-3-O-[3-hydroxymyristoyl] N-acetylglucosamine deacetylase
MNRTSIAQEIELKGAAVHSGVETSLRLLPAKSGAGISFTRTDLPHRPKFYASYDQVVDTRLCTTLGSESGDSLSTVEHLMAAISGCGIDDLDIEVGGAEVPVMDGSAKVFVDAIKQADIQPNGKPRQFLVITKAVEVRAGDSFARLTPADNFQMKVEIDFPNKTIGKQSFEIEAPSSSQVNLDSHFAAARTFGFYEDLEKLRAMGLAQGSSLENTIAIKDDVVMNKGDLRYDNEFARHKALDALGDLALATLPIIGIFHSFKGGHSLNNQLLHALFADKTCYTIRHAS